MTEHDFERTARLWLEDGPSAMPDRALDAALAEIHVTDQRRPPWTARRDLPMFSFGRLTTVAAAVAVAAVVGLSLLPGSNIGSNPTPTLSPSPSPVPTRSPELLNDQERGKLAPGPYIFEADPVRLTITVPANWERLMVDNVVWAEGSNSRLAAGGVDNVYADPCQPALGVRQPSIGPTVADFVSALQEFEEWQVSAGVDAGVAGYPATMVEMSTPPGGEPCEGRESRLYAAGTGFSVAPGPGETFRMWVVDVDGHRLVIQTATRPGSTAHQRNQLQEMVDSAQIAVVPPTSPSPAPGTP